MPPKNNPKQKRWTDWECPECTANNVHGDGFVVGDELFCAWCGQVFQVRRGEDEDRFKLVLA